MSDYPTEVLVDSPLVYYRLGEASGTTMTDSSGNGRNGVYTSVILGRPGLQATDGDTSALFCGTPSAGTVATYAAWMSPTALTVEAWIQTTAGGLHSIIDRDGDAGSRAFQFRQNGGSLEFITINGGAGVVTSSHAGAINDGLKHHVAATYDAANIKLYIDGALVKTTAAAGALSTQTPGLRVGVNNSAGNAAWFAGILDEAAYYGTALSGARIAAHYNATPSAATGLAGTWALVS